MVSLSLFFFFLAVLRGLWDLSSLTRDQIRGPGSESEESQILDRQGIPSVVSDFIRCCPQLPDDIEHWSVPVDHVSLLRSSHVISSCIGTLKTTRLATPKGVFRLWGALNYIYSSGIYLPTQPGCPSVNLQFTIEKPCSRDFLSGPVVKTPPFTAGGTGSIPGRGTKIPHACGVAKRKTKTARKPCSSLTCCSLLCLKDGSSVLLPAKA